MPKHSFQSPLISTVRLVEHTPDRIVFAGHYRHGDGASGPAMGSVVAVVLVLIWHLSFSHWALIVAAAIVFLASNAVLLYEKKIEFLLPERRIALSTRTWTGTRQENRPFEQARLRVESIAIRIATDCGAVDLVLPEQTIRLGVDGKIDRSAAKAASLSASTGIPVEP